MRGLTKRWTPSSKDEFPTSKHMRGGEMRTRRANPDHLQRFPWLAISRHDKFWGAWCANCALMGATEAGGRSGTANQKLGNLVTRPLRDFSDLTGKNGALSVHNASLYHRDSTAAVAALLRTAANSEEQVSSVLATASRKELERNRAALASIIDTIKFAAIQNMPLRGHRDDGRIDPSGEYPVENDGNFRMLLRFRLQSGDKALEEHMRSAAGNALYTSKGVQNELLQDILQLVTAALSQKISASPLWALIADETTDRAHREQLVIVARYIDCSEQKHQIR